jgi:hypothetical protein
MSITGMLTRRCAQTAVYWGTPTEDNYGGKTFAAPVEIACRWVDKSEIIASTTGQELVSRAMVHVLQDLDEQGYLYLGTLADLSATEEANPKIVTGAFEIKQFHKVPSLDGSVYVRKAYL